MGRKSEEPGLAQREAARVAALEQRGRQVQGALEKLRTSSRSSTLCDAALQLGRLEVYEAIPDLEALLRDSESPSVQYCAAAVLADLGETDTALAFHVEGARSPDPERQRLALVGFGDFGPAAANVGLPYLEEALHSPEQTVRFAAVLALSRMGEAGEPLLRQALDDPAPGVREFAAQALAR